MLEKDATAADSNATRNKLNKDIEKLKKKHIELLAYDEKLRHYADLRIQFDLDDGVKFNIHAQRTWNCINPLEGGQAVLHRRQA